MAGQGTSIVMLGGWTIEASVRDNGRLYVTIARAGDQSGIGVTVHPSDAVGGIAQARQLGLEVSTPSIEAAWEARHP